MTRIVLGLFLDFLQCVYLGSLSRIWLQLCWLVFGYCVEVYFVSSDGLIFRLGFGVNLGLFQFSLGLHRIRVTLGFRIKS